MSKFVKFVLFISVVLILAGGAFIGIAFAKGEFKDLSGNTVTNVHNIDDEFDSVLVDTSITDYEFKLSDDKKCHVECVEREKMKHSVEVIDGTLTIKQTDDRKWYERMLFNFNVKLTVLLPLKEYNDIVIKDSTGDINLDLALTINNIDIKVSTGDIKFKDITVKNDIKIESSTGDVSYTNVKANNINSKTTTGEQLLKDTIVSENLEIESSTGDIMFIMIDAKSIKVRSTTGDVKGTLLTNKTFYCKTTTGDINVPKTQGDICDIETTTGDINISIKE